MEQHHSTQLKLSDLIRNGKPLTATSLSSLHSTNCDTIPNSSISTTPKTLAPLNYPAHLSGTLTLPTASPASHNCFQFSDGSASVCCDIINFDVRIIGKQINVVSWNFVPLKRQQSGFLEIIEWKVLDCGGMLDYSNVGSFALGMSSELNGGGCVVHGELEFISPVSVFPSLNEKSEGVESSGSKGLRGFIAQVMVCKCKLCCSKELVNVLEGSSDVHCFSKPVFVFFCGSASYWHPVFTKFVGNVMSLSGLKKKMVFIGRNESRLMFVTVDKSILHLPTVMKRVPRDRMADVDRKVEFGSYTGSVSGIYMHGMVVELDKDVWLLLTDRLLSLPHSLRVGALISVRNIHFVNPKYCWTKALILGACYKTSVILESFSPLETGCLVSTSSSSLLGKFIDSTTFSARFWVLLVVSCLRRKLAGILSEKEILGSKNVTLEGGTGADICLFVFAFHGDPHSAWHIH